MLQDFLDLFGLSASRGGNLSAADGAEPVPVDTDNDGIPDSLLVDTDGNGSLDGMLMDMDGDGVFETLALDTNGDGLFDSVAMDTDGNGTLDTLFTDTDNDGTLDTEIPLEDDSEPVPVDTGYPQPGDSVDMDEDGVIDGVWVDTDGDNCPDAILFASEDGGPLDSLAADTDGNGTLDTLYVDTDHDNQFDAQFSLEDNPPDAMSFPKDGLPMDMDGDRVNESMLVDTDGDNIPDALLVDTNGDNAPDVLLMDTNHNGNFNVLLADTDHDGRFDLKMTDTNGDGKYDTSEQDTNGDGRPDTYWMDTDGDGKDDLKMSDLDGDGVMDVALRDTDADQIFDAVVHLHDLNADGVWNPGEPLLVGPASTYETFDPQNSAHVVGNPAETMESWHTQESGTSCAVVCQEFLLEHVTGRDFQEGVLRDLAEREGWYNPNGGTVMGDVGKLLEEMGLRVERSDGNGVEDLQRCLENGGGVIAVVDSSELWTGENDDMLFPGMQADHAVEVIGLDRSDPEHPMVILNDSGVANGGGAMVPLDVFMDAWEDSNFYMVEAYPPTI